MDRGCWEVRILFSRKGRKPRKKQILFVADGVEKAALLLEGVRAGWRLNMWGTVQPRNLKVKCDSQPHGPCTNSQKQP